MKLLIVSEGKHELGDVVLQEKNAALRTFVERLIGREAEYSHEKITHPDFRGAHGKGGRYFKRALRCIQRAREWGFDALVLVVDQDGDEDRRGQFDRAQEHPGESHPRALGIAAQTFDAWILADEQALSRIIGATIQRQPDPESIDDPKARCRDLRDSHHCGASLTGMYGQVAAVADLATIESRCPKGFGVFAARVRRL